MSHAYDRELELESELETEDEALVGLTRSSFPGEEELEDELEMEEEVEAEEELEGAFEDEFSRELMGQFEDEMEVEGEDELELELEEETEDELELESEEEDEAFLGGLANIASSLLGEGEEEYAYEAEDEEEFFFKKIGRFLKRNSGLLKKIAKVAGPMIATAVGGPAAGAVARALTSQLEGELEDELEAELEEMATSPVTGAQAYAEFLAAKAATAESETEAEAFAGSAVTITLTARERRRLQEMLPHLVRGTSILTRVLHRNPASRPAVRLIPGIVASAARTLSRNAAAGTIQPADVATVLNGSMRRVLADPRWRYGAARRHARGLAYMRRRYPYGYRRYWGGRPSYDGLRRRPYYGSGGRRSSGFVTRRPVHVRAVSRNARVTRPRAGYVRVVTPVRVPPRGGRPARTIRVVSDVKVPRGAVPAGRPASLAGKRRTR
jgi:hypothetical protein